MNWESFYLICFVAGLMLSAVALLGGMGHLHFGGHVHVPHIPHSVAGAAHGVSNVTHAAASGASSGMKVPWWNGFSAMIFLCWFGAAGYLLTRYGGFVAGVVLTLAVVCGVAGGAIVFVFLTRVLLPHERELTADETAVVGAVGKISAAIQPGGTGEIVYQQMGALRSAPARAEDGSPIPKQEEVFVVRYEKGIAYVRRWEEGAGTRE
ncbi:MAG TPA: hypothetical protein VF742_11400 [Terracidiphilus sp.]|jgi:hypothetical protein